METTNLSKATFGTLISRPTDLRTVELADIIKEIKTGRFMHKIEQVRSAKDEEQAKALKANLPYFIYGIVKEKRTNENVEQMNGIILDYDHLEDIEAFKQTAILSLPNVRYAFRSPRDGVKLVIPFSRAITKMQGFPMVWNYIKEICDATLDKVSDNTPDPARACFVSFDRDLLENENWLAFDLDECMDEILQFARVVDHGTHEKDGTHRKMPVVLPSGGLKVDTFASNVCSTDEASVTTTKNRINAGLQTTPLLISDETASEERIRSAIDFLTQTKIDYNDWIKCGFAIYNKYGEAGKPLWDSFINNPHYKETQANLDTHWKSFNQVKSVSIGSLIHIARQYGWEVGQLSTIDQTHGRLGTANLQTTKKRNFNAELMDLFGKPVNVELDISKLPVALQEYIALTDTITDAQPGAKLTAWLPTIAANIGNRVFMNNNSARIFSHIWGIIIGPSSISRKTTVIKLAKQTLEPFEETLDELTPDEYLAQTLIMTDVTMTKLLQMLSENPNRVFIQMEVSAWIKMMNRNWNSGMKQALTDLYDGVDKTIANMLRCDRIRKPAFSIIAATTEGWFYQEMKDAADQQSGFLHRFLFCIIQNINAEDIDLSYREGEETCPELRKYEEMYSVFRSIPGHCKISLSPEASAYRDEEYKKRFLEVAKTKNDSVMGYFTRIYDGYFFKFCIVFHLMKHWQGLKDAMENASTDIAKHNRVRDYFIENPVSLETVQEALYLCNYYFENTKPFLASLAENTKLLNERKLVNLLCKYPNGTISHSSLLNRSRLNKREFKEAIDSLIERDAITVTAFYNSQNNKTAKTYVLAPELFDSWEKEDV